MIRQAENEDVRRLAELWARAFPGERSVEQRIRQLETGGVYGGIESSYIAESQGRLLGAFRAFALGQHMHGAVYPIMGLAAVAVDETARRRGVGRMLCVEAARLALERGDVLSVLFPFRPSFYQSLGWGYVGEMHAYRFRPESLVRTHVGDVTRASVDETAAIAACYGRVAGESNGLIARTPRVWRQTLEGDGTYVYVTGGRGRIDGYMIVRFGRGPSPDERPLYVTEMVAADREAADVLFGWLAAQRDSWRVVLYDATPDERFDQRLSEPRPPGFRAARYLWAPVARIIRGPMLRVLDVPAALERRQRWPASPPLRFGLEIADDVLPDNAGPFDIDFDGHRAHVRRADAPRPTLRTRIDTFAQIFAGELDVQEALALGLAEANGDIATVHTLFRRDRCFRMLDEF